MKIGIISGHGDGRKYDGIMDVGACGLGYQEYKLTRKQAPYLKKALERYDGVKCTIINGSEDIYQKLAHGYAVNFKPYDLVIELHINSAGTSQANGFEVLYPNNGNSKTAKMVADHVSNAMNMTNRGAKLRGDLFVINACRNEDGVQAFLIESGFIKNSYDMKQVNNMSKFCEEIAEGFAKAYGLSIKKEKSTYYTSKNLARVETTQSLWLYKDKSLSKKIKRIKVGTEFKVYDIYTTKSGATRLKVDGGWITGNQDFVSSTHWLMDSYGGKTKVEIIKECDYCSDVNLKKVKGHCKPGEVYTVVDNVKGSNGYQRLKLKSGYYITADKSKTRWI